MGRRMVKVSVEVRSGTARFRVRVRAQSIRSTLALVGARYPTGDAGVVYHVEPEGFFADGLAALAGMVATEHRDELAA